MRNALVFIVLIPGCLNALAQTTHFQAGIILDVKSGDILSEKWAKPTVYFRGN